ncbi:MAG: hypothetical protein QXO13_01770 [Candidatus Anstonellales archaeon]
MRRFLAFEVENSPELEDVYKYFSRFKDIRISRFRHVTLSFLGDMEYDPEIIRDYFRDKHAFNVRYRGIGGFPSIRWARVIWIGVEFNYDIMADFPYPKNEIYHLTIGRVNGMDLSRLDLRRFDRILFEQSVSNINLYETIIPGREYRIIVSYYLIQ